MVARTRSGTVLATAIPDYAGLVVRCYHDRPFIQQIKEFPHG
jgi:hypothetical protein